MLSLRRPLSVLVCAMVVVLVTAVSAAASPIVYMRSSTAAPWGIDPSNPGSNEAAMNLAFGAGSWDDLRYETANLATLFSPTTNFIFMEGGNGTANELETFLNANMLLIQGWVSAGGSLFINAAPNEGDGMSFGFGVTLTYPDFDGSGTATAADPNHAVFNGPLAPVGTNFTGGHFTHATVTGGGLSPIILTGSGEYALAEMDWGLGHVMFGGMTLAFFHNPDPNAYNLRANILSYGATSTAPEPATFSLLGIGLAGFLARRRRRS